MYEHGYNTSVVPIFGKTILMMKNFPIFGRTILMMKMYSYSFLAIFNHHSPLQNCCTSLNKYNVQPSSVRFVVEHGGFKIRQKSFDSETDPFVEIVLKSNGLCLEVNRISTVANKGSNQVVGGAY